ncbi:hypothetical protein SASPL_111333 [Salvia splendens]|uniref:Peptidase M10 metallopeptidase domain-containing protein n=1 Tax=Salvia splendens TaxID=180675 RepID=A0A8X9A3I9_SALSN|nr:metalloendoproteinase 2-MMP-like [Salvia splendens]KAG6427093.1 hypothetical protein SASPL_111333 [Salvia splendens]
MNFGLSQTGELNDETMLKMVTPRCGFPDGINTMILPSGKHNKTEAETEFPSYYDFFRGRPRWPYTRLSYTYVSGFPEMAKPFMDAAFAQWANVSVFTFYENLGFFESDIVIGFFRGGARRSDGPRGVLAHAFAPDEKWSFKSRAIGGIHFE